MLTVYRLVTFLALPVVLVRLLLRGLRNKAYLQRIPERFGFTGIQPDPGGIWVHAVSVGEVNAAVPLIEQLENRWPEKSITVTTMTTTGSDRVSKLFGERVSHCYLPYDYPWAVGRFIRRIKPGIGLVMETEVWPNFIHHCHKRQIPLLYTNVRMSEHSAQGYMRFKALFRPVFQRINALAVQSEPDARRLIQLGAIADRVQVTGSLKFEMNLPASTREAGEAVRRTLGNSRPVLLAASTHEGEEQAMLEVFKRIQQSMENLLLVIVPRHPERFTAVARQVRKAGHNVALLSNNYSDFSTSTEVFIVDAMGELPVFIAASDVTFMGGSLVAVGGHNPLEAAALARPVVFGPNMFNFAEIADLFLQHGAGIQVEDQKELEEVLQRLLDDSVLRDQYGKQGIKLVEQNRGALGRVIAMVEQLIIDAAEYRSPDA